ncbi:hypothetical protein UPYG_G00037940 [Umbra pygmaea]|uniref:UPAR/Ly6 domain-containing protein n=1 Tax=Umbra pygmaea TaxID=75934 RepID=A0ABD0XPB9_UMBPY
MKFILTLCLICTLCCSVEMLQCNNCLGTQQCTTNTISSTCPNTLNNTCLAANVTTTGFLSFTQVAEFCSPLPTCETALNTSVSVNLGFLNISSNLFCCTSDGCNTALPAGNRTVLLIKTTMYLQ